MSRQVSRGSAGEYQADEQAGVARLSWRACAGACARLTKAGTTYTTTQLLRVVQGPKQRTCGERRSSETVKLGQPEQ